MRNQPQSARRLSQMIVAVIVSFPLAAGFTSSAVASSVDLHIAYKNSLTINSPRQAREIWLNADGSYQEFRADLSPQGHLMATGLGGTYVAEAGAAGVRVCLSPVLHAGPVDHSSECLPLKMNLAQKWQIEMGADQSGTAGWRKGRSRDIPAR